MKCLRNDGFNREEKKTINDLVRIRKHALGHMRISTIDGMVMPESPKSIRGDQSQQEPEDRGP